MINDKMGMTVKELIEFLKTQPQELRVAYRIHSECALLEVERIKLAKLQRPRPDGWIHFVWSDDESLKQETYLVFPGN